MIKNICQYRLPIETLEGNGVAVFTGAQVYMKPYVAEMMIFWWVVWGVTLAVVIYRFIVQPLISKYRA